MIGQFNNKTDDFYSYYNSYGTLNSLEDAKAVKKKLKKAEEKARKKAEQKFKRSLEEKMLEQQRQFLAEKQTMVGTFL